MVEEVCDSVAVVRQRRSGGALQGRRSRRDRIPVRTKREFVEQVCAEGLEVDRRGRTGIVIDGQGQLPGRFVAALGTEYVVIHHLEVAFREERRGVEGQLEAGGVAQVHLN